ncbi:Nitroreductase [Syntrophomonas zehnderi OL-4]|uniref:Nitroreductase n=1 Tax=Syntrophomonas zehnderi OL-4 TaxID=690567 RepID=A0A0E4GAW1_9FIRM|nr:nitroreductase family protein [Syntrophomonas zehnderi]CFX70507.1 Nitroreductase [Syntrophomonas zehnderi OL-4]
MMKTIIFGLIGFIGVAVIALLTLSGAFVKPAYLEPWEKDYPQKFADPRIQLAAHGLLAANGHNMQPWKIRLKEDDPRVFYLYADSDRLTKEVDPLARQAMITQGTFLGYINMAGKKLGYKTDIILFPQGGYDEQRLAESMSAMPVAQITLAKETPASAPFYDYMFWPETNRAPYQSTRLSAEQIKGLKNINRDDDMSIRFFQDKENLDKLRSYAMQGATIEAGVNRVMQESETIFRANEYQKNQYRYGFSIEGQGNSGIMKHLMQGLVTLFPSLNSGKPAADLFIQSTQTAVDNTPVYTMIISKDNTRVNQVKSGMLYSEMILAAHQQGLVMQPLSQVLEEYPEMNELYQGIHRDYAPDGGTIQMLMRVGKPTKEVPPSMRRDVMDLIIKE